MSEPHKVSVARRAAFSAQALVRFFTEPRAPYRSWTSIERAQRRRIRRTVAHAIEHVPHYREACRKLGLGPGDFQSAADLARLPLIEREDLQRDPEYFVSDEQPLDSYTSLRSSGSTGRPISVFLGARDLVDRGCIGCRSRRLRIPVTDGRRRPRVAMIFPPRSNGAEFTRAAHRALIMPFDPRPAVLRLEMSGDPAEELPALNDFQPDAVYSYGSYIEALFAHAIRSGQPFHRPKLVSYGSDSISPGARKMLMEELGIEVLSVYQAIETPQVGFECERHRGYHLNVDVCPLRIVDGDGRELPGGESGEVVISDLTNRSTVLLNYRLGDRAAALPEPCDCGRTLPLLSYVEGRNEEWAVGSNGRPIHVVVLGRAFLADDEAWGFLIEQLDIGRYAAMLVPAPGADGEALRARVRERFAEQFPDESLDISLVDSLPRTGGGKVRRVLRVRGPGA